MATLFRVTSAFYSGFDFYPAGTILSAADPALAGREAYCELFEVPEPTSADDELEALRTYAENVGIKVDKRWKADRLRDEIAAAEGH